MTKAGKRKPGKRSADRRLIRAAREAAAIARGEAKPARVHGAANVRRLRDAVTDAEAGNLTEFDPTQAALEMQMADATRIMQRRSNALRDLVQAATVARGTVWPAYWTHEAGGGEHLYYFAPVSRRPPPYRRQIKVEATVDVADDGTLAGIEFFVEDVPPPK